MSISVKRLVARIAIAGMILCATVVGSTSVAPHTQAATASLTLSPTSGPPGTLVMVYGSAFQPNATFRFYWGKKFIAAGTTDATGAFSLGWIAPTKGDGSKGSVTVTVSDPGIVATAVFTIT